MSNYLGFEPTAENDFFFVSYNNEDAGRLSPLVNRLSQEEVNLWYDYGIPYGSIWAETISKKIRESKAVIFFLTKGIFEKGKNSYVYKEYKMCKKHKKQHIFILVDRIDDYVVPDSMMDWWIDIDDMQSVILPEISAENQISEILRSLNAVSKADKPAGKIHAAPGPMAKESFSGEKAKLLYDSENYKELLSYCIQFSDDCEAQNMLGNCYSSGKGVTQDDKEAIKWYTKAAEQEDPDAQYNLGKCYYFGEGVTQNHEEAVKWFTKAAEHGYSKAQGMLGICYYLGDGVTQDDKEAVKWFTKAAEQGNLAAQGMLGDCYYNGTGVTQNYEEAVKWCTKAAEQGDPNAQCILGRFYYLGEGVDRDYKEAVKWFTKAAEQGDQNAQYMLGDCYYNGNGVTRDYKEAVKWLTKAAEQGHQGAIDTLEHIKHK